MFRSLLSAAWALAICYPDPRVLLTAIRNTMRPPISAEAVAAWARSLPDDPAEIERAVHEHVKYAVPWSRRAALVAGLVAIWLWPKRRFSAKLIG